MSDARRENFDMPEDFRKELRELAALPFMVVARRSPADLTDACWARLAALLDFDVETVEPIDGNYARFSAVRRRVSENT